MIEFDEFVARHGEAAAQALLETAERLEKKRAEQELPLEERWNHLWSNPANKSNRNA